MKVVVMSKVKPKKKKQLASEAGKDNSEKKKKKYWMRMKFKKKAKEEKKAPCQLLGPPKDAKLFSSNWKALQEILKSSQMTAVEPTTTQQQPNGPLQEKKTKASKNVHQNTVSSSKTDSEQKVKRKSVDSQAKIPGVDTKQSAGFKRKNTYKANGEQAAKKKKVEATESKPTEQDIWFDDVDPDDIEVTVGPEAAEIVRKRQGVHKEDTQSMLVKEKAFQGLTRSVAIDCEMVGVGPSGEDSILARVSVVNQFGKCVYDKFVKPSEKVTDYRTAVSGIRPQDIKDGEDVSTVRKEVAEILKGRIVVGHALQNDFKILLLDHPKKKIRDTQKYKPFKKTVETNRPSLKVLCKKILNVNVQQGEHSSVQDAQATMRLYTLVKKQWEADIKNSADKKSEKRKPKSSKSAGKRRVAGLSF
ncbi:RNA exonuclease 4 [Syngnathoides biaculeatus]|uniref:RNA exonuclease 4 n=1 Tax=Syngnathoides biaculeatus TaxID=300417 RepID=UPI002ADDA2DF|nr:RNA exonuclease 4 [Syngnathoides biaculeatus]